MWDGPKSPHTFRCSDMLWNAFVTKTKVEGDSVCHLMEAIIAAILGVHNAQDYKRNTIRIERLSVQRVVQRHRRISHRYKPEKNCYDPSLGWYYKKDADLNVNGHAVECKCKVCDPRKLRMSH